MAVMGTFVIRRPPAAQGWDVIYPYQNVGWHRGHRFCVYDRIIKRVACSPRDPPSKRSNTIPFYLEKSMRSSPDTRLNILVPHIRGKVFAIFNLVRLDSALINLSLSLSAALNGRNYHQCSAVTAYLHVAPVYWLLLMNVTGRNSNRYALAKGNNSETSETLRSVLTVCDNRIGENSTFITT